MPTPITAVLCGAGMRGLRIYGPYAHQYPDELKFIAVAEPDPGRRERFAAEHSIPRERQFASWEELLDHKQMADVLLNTTQDQMHYSSTVAALSTGYAVLLEKPMAPSLAENIELVRAAERSGRLLQVCHVLRYTPFFSTLHDILASGRLGEIITVEHRENVVYWHMAHSYVRGHWRNTALSSPMILAKCCHDLDILYWNLGCSVRRVQSFGSLKHFRPEHAPAGATLRCTDGCPAGDTCPYDARRIYLDPQRPKPAAWVSNDLSLEARQELLETSAWGRCVYFCDNDVVDHQTVNMDFENGATAVLFMHGHSHEESRTMRYDGTRATLRGKFTYENSWIEIHNHLTGQCEELHIPPAPSGHGGGDFGVVRAFLEAVRNGRPALTSARDALESHLMAFAAEESRLNRRVVDLHEFRQQVQTL